MRARNLFPPGDAVSQILGAVEDFVRNHFDMREANTIGGDKYFHCVANCQAAQRGSVGAATASFLSNLREWLDLNRPEFFGDLFT